MSDVDALPLFPTVAPDVFRDAAATVALFEPTLARLAALVDVDTAALTAPTPCAGFDVAALRRHVLAWLQFFAAALNDADGTTARIDPESWDLAPTDRPSAIVERAAADIVRAARAGAVERVLVMSQARMAGDGVLAMALGEYLVHGWDLAVATGRAYDGDEVAAAPALAFLHSTVAPQFRGPDSGMFDHEVPAPPDAGAFVRLLCFTGRDAGWTAPAA